MHDLQELVRLHRLGTSYGEIARLLGLSRMTERKYRRSLADAGLLHGDPEQLPELEVLKQIIAAAHPQRQGYEQPSSVQRWCERIEDLLEAGATPTAIYDRLRLEEKDFRGSLSAVKRLCARLKKKHGPTEDEVAIPVETAPGKVAQVDFGYIGKLYDEETHRMRKAYVFVMVLCHSRHQVSGIVFD